MSGLKNTSTMVSFFSRITMTSNKLAHHALICVFGILCWTLTTCVPSKLLTATPVALLSESSTQAFLTSTPVDITVPQDKQPSTELIKILSATPRSQTELDFSYIRKLDSHIQTLLIDYLKGNDINQIASREGIEISDLSILVDIYINGEVKVADSCLREIGMDIRAQDNVQHIAEGWLPLDSILEAAQCEKVQAIIPVTAFVTND